MLEILSDVKSISLIDRRWFRQTRGVMMGHAGEAGRGDFYAVLLMVSELTMMVNKK